MQYAQQYINNATTIIQAYNGSLPFHLYLKQFFAVNKKYGSKDRKRITQLCYCYFRLGKAATALTTEEKIKLSLYLCNDEVGEWQILFTNEWITNWSNNLAARIHFAQQQYKIFAIENIFSWQDELSTDVDASTFSAAHLVQPDLFLRLRPNFESGVKQKLIHNNIPFQELTSTCIALPNASKIDTVIQLNKEVVVQDYSSQQIATFFKLIQNHQLPTTNITVWDCCAASGGKSILAVDVFKKIELSVSDVRPSILANLKTRFAQAGLNQYKSFIADLSKKIISTTNNYQLIICDAPCTGSGTWGRTPEQLSFFTQEKITEYSNLQKQIVSHAVKQLHSNGFFLYITCSVFTKENEEVVSFIQNQLQLSLIKKELLIGYTQKADTLFAALFTTKKILSQT